MPQALYGWKCGVLLARGRIRCNVGTRFRKSLQKCRHRPDKGAEKSEWERQVNGRKQKQRKATQSGFTVVEAGTGLATLLSALLVGLPLYDVLNDRGPVHLLQEASLASHLEYARREAVRLETVVTVCPSRDGRNCQPNGDWKQGWLIFTDDASPPMHFSVGDTMLHRQEGAVESQPLVAAMDLVRYQADGSIQLN